MLTQPVKCLHCGSADLVRNGHSKKGKQRFQCRACKKYGRENPGGNAYDENTKSLILAACQERSSIRGLSRTFGVSRNTAAAWLKKASELPLLAATLMPAQADDVLELDEYN